MSVYVGNTPRRVLDRQDASYSDAPASAPYMPFSTRLLLGKELNRLWVEFTEEMYDGPLVGEDAARKFWSYVTSRKG